jgi:hypothetical protein
MDGNPYPKHDSNHSPNALYVKQLHVSATYSRHHAEHRTINKKTVQCNKVVEIVIPTPDKIRITVQTPYM